MEKNILLFQTDSFNCTYDENILKECHNMDDVGAPTILYNQSRIWQKWRIFIYLKFDDKIYCK